MWARIDDGLPEHRKLFAAASEIQRAGYARALAMILQAICYSNRSLSDGFLPSKIADSFHDPRPSETIRALVKAGIWEVVDGGFQIHDYDDYQINSEEIKQKRQKDRERKHADSTRIPDGVATDSTRIPDGVATDSTRIPERSRARVPSHPIPSHKNNGNTTTSRPEEKLPVPTRDFLVWFQAEYAKRRSGAKYAVKWEAHGAIVKRLLKIHEFERLKKHAVMLLRTDEDWSSTTDRGIEVLSAKINWLEERLAAWEKTREVRKPM